MLTTLQLGWIYPQQITIISFSRHCQHFHLFKRLNEKHSITVSLWECCGFTMKELASNTCRGSEWVVS